MDASLATLITRRALRGRRIRLNLSRGCHLYRRESDQRGCEARRMSEQLRTIDLVLGSARVADRAIVKAPYLIVIRIRSAYVSYSTSSSANHVVEQLSGFYSLLYARCSCAVRAVGPFLRAGT